MDHWKHVTVKPDRDFKENSLEYSSAKTSDSSKEGNYYVENIWVSSYKKLKPINKDLFTLKQKPGVDIVTSTRPALPYPNLN